MRGNNAFAIVLVVDPRVKLDGVASRNGETVFGAINELFDHVERESSSFEQDTMTYP